MKKLALLVTLFAAASAALPTAAEVLSRAQESFLRNRRIAVSRDTATIPGHVITTWQRNGRIESVVTNALRDITGTEQRNPIQTLAERYRAAAADVSNRLAAVTQDYMSASNRAARAEARHDRIVAWAEQQRDKAALSTTKALWQSIIDRLNADD